MLFLLYSGQYLVSRDRGHCLPRVEEGIHQVQSSEERSPWFNEVVKADLVHGGSRGSNCQVDSDWSICIAMVKNFYSPDNASKGRSARLQDRTLAS